MKTRSPSPTTLAFVALSCHPPLRRRISHQPTNAVCHNNLGPRIRRLNQGTTPGRFINGVPAPLAEDEDSDFGRESWYDLKDNKKRKIKGRRSGRRGVPGKSDVKNSVDDDDDRVANFNLLDHGFPSDGSGEESFFDADHSESYSRLPTPSQFNRSISM